MKRVFLLITFPCVCVCVARFTRVKYKLKRKEIENFQFLASALVFAFASHVTRPLVFNPVYLFACCFLYLGGFWGHLANSVNSKESPLVSMYQRPLIVPSALRYSGPNKNGNFGPFDWLSGALSIRYNQIQSLR